MSRTFGTASLADPPRNLSDLTQLAIIPESELVLRDRDFVRGDVVKRSLDQVESGVIMQVSTEVRLVNSITGEVVGESQWIPMKKLASSLPLEPGDKVVYNNWLGTIKDVSAGRSARAKWRSGL